MKIIQLGMFLLITSMVVIAQCSALGSAKSVHLLREKYASGGEVLEGFSCASWRLGVEAHNVIDWTTIPEQCEDYVGHYLLGSHYRADSKVVVDEAISYAESLRIPIRDGIGNNSIWVFDVDETSLSNLPYFADHGFGAEPINSTLFGAYVGLGTSPALPETLRLYIKLLSLGIKVVFLTGRSEYQWSITAANLNNVGYHTWERLIVRTRAYQNTTAVFYKSAERGILEKQGYQIVGNIGDQWSDILGSHEGKRSFKLPDPMYYIA